MRFYYFARSTTVPQKLNGSDDDLRRILQFDGALPCCRKKEQWKFSILMRENTLVAK